MTGFTTPRNQVSINTFGASAPTAIPATLPGSLVVVQVQVQLGAGTLASVVGKDSQGNVVDTLTMVPLANPGTNQRHVETWYTTSSAGGAVSYVPDTGGATSVNFAGGISEWAVTGAALRTQASKSNTSSATPAAATATPVIGDLVIGQMAYQATVASTQQEHLADATYTALPRVTRGTTNMWAGAYKVATAATATGPSWTMDNGAGTGTAVATGEVTAVFTLAGGPPAAAFTSTSAGPAASFDASASSATGSSTIASYAWNFGDTNTGNGVSPSHTYAQAGTYTVQLTVTDSTGQTGTVSHPVTVTAPAAQVTPVAVLSATGWTVTGAAGNAVTAMSDTDQSSYVVSPVSPSGVPFRLQLAAMTTPAAGTDMTVTVEVDMTAAASGTVSAKLYEGSTVRAIAAPQNLASAAVGSNTVSTLTFTFPAASIANVTSWNALQVEFTVNAS